MTLYLCKIAFCELPDGTELLIPCSWYGKANSAIGNVWEGGEFQVLPGAPTPVCRWDPAAGSFPIDSQVIQHTHFLSAQQPGQPCVGSSNEAMVYKVLYLRPEPLWDPCENRHPLSHCAFSDVSLRPNGNSQLPEPSLVNRGEQIANTAGIHSASTEDIHSSPEQSVSILCQILNLGSCRFSK